MPVRLPETPQSAAAVVRVALTDLLRHGGFRTPALSRAQPEALALTLPHPIYSLTADDLASGKGLAAARLTGWRYLIQEGDRVLASAEVKTDETGQVLGFSQLTEGPYVLATVAALERADAQPEIAVNSYEARLLQISAVYLTALWLKDEVATGDLIQPLDPAPEGLDSSRTYREQELMPFLAESAGLSLTFRATPEDADSPGGMPHSRGILRDASELIAAAAGSLLRAILSSRSHRS